MNSVQIAGEAFEDFGGGLRPDVLLVGMAARHKVDPPRLHQHTPDTFWPAAVFLEECVILHVDTKFELWRELINDICSLRLDSCGIAEQLWSWRAP
ncbi:hypothetical protein ACFC0C_15970 [Streptomyces sp. NPDC056178]|uniref:hypothetical protein n=1 Tax=unclassified Streptomyces TaxID=2593676 RepID=UPI0035E03E9E